MNSGQASGLEALGWDELAEAVEQFIAADGPNTGDAAGLDHGPLYHWRPALAGPDQRPGCEANQAPNRGGIVLLAAERLHHAGAQLGTIIIAG